ncbi:MAG: hypothetical protein NDI94_02475 [Candidatus Woesearchaeota archaeon]|nr:hypothetical protein [Candidatus Woesearchaeota archaeon]
MVLSSPVTQIFGTLPVMAQPIEMPSFYLLYTEYRLLPLPHTSIRLAQINFEGEHDPYKGIAKIVNDGALRRNEQIVEYLRRTHSLKDNITRTGYLDRPKQWNFYDEDITPGWIMFDTVNGICLPGNAKIYVAGVQNFQLDDPSPFYQEDLVSKIVQARDKGENIINMPLGKTNFAAAYTPPPKNNVSYDRGFRTSTIEKRLPNRPN